MVITDKPAEKALVLLKVTQNSVGKNLSGGYRILTDQVEDATEATGCKKYGAVALCSFEHAPDFTLKPKIEPDKEGVALAIVSKVTTPAKSMHCFDLYTEVLQVVSKDMQANAIQMMT